MIVLQKTITINNKFGIHARPSSIISELVNQFKSQVVIKYNGNEADASSIMNLILLCVEPGAQIELVVEGEDEQTVFVSLVQYLEVDLLAEEKN